MIFPPPTRRVLAAMTEALGADEEDEHGLVPLPEAVVTRVVLEYDAWISSASPTLPLALTLVATLIELLPLFLVGRFSRMSQLPLAERIDFLERVEGSSLGLLAAGFMGLKVGLVMLIYEQGAELHETGFDRESLRVRRKLPVAGVAR